MYDPNLDLRAVPLMPAAAVLRWFGCALLDAVLKEQDSPALAELAARPDLLAGIDAGLAECVSASEVAAALPRVLALPYGGKLRPLPAIEDERQTMLDVVRFAARRLRAWWAARGDYAVTADAAALRARLRATLSPRSTSRHAELLLPYVLDRSLGGVSPDWLPDRLWATAAEAAWREPLAAVAHARALRAALGRRTLFLSSTPPFPVPPPFPVLAPRTLWALIALTRSGGPAPRRGPARLRRWRRVARAGDGLERLRDAATHQVLSVGGWAGLWDQWVMLEAWDLWSGGRERIHPTLQDALERLPLRTWGAVRAQAAAGQRTGPQTAGAQGEAQGPVLAAPDWDADLPPWLGLLAQWDDDRRGSPRFGGSSQGG